MILELGDGRELTLPDDMSDEAARQIGRLLLAAEAESKRHAANLARIEAELLLLKSKGTPTAPPAPVIVTEKADMRPVIQLLQAGNEQLARMAPTKHDNSDVIAAINAMRREITAGLAKSAALAAADRVIVYDSLGTPRSRIAPQTGKA